MSGYADWLRLVDVELERVVGLSHRDLSDRNWRDEFEAETPPREAALDAIADEPGGEALLESLDELEIAGAIDEASGAVTSDADPGL